MRILAKILRHKTMPDTYGVIDRTGLFFEIHQTHTHPQLIGSETSMEQLRLYWQKYSTGGPLQDQLNDYDLITIQMTEVNEATPQGVQGEEVY